MADPLHRISGWSGQSGRGLPFDRGNGHSAPGPVCHRRTPGQGLPSQGPLRQPGKAQSGFALVVALTLMGFVLLLLLSLSVLLAVEVATTQQNRALMMARENARLGLMVALGELQRTAGPDQRVTARAEILGVLADNDPKRYWTGVWDTQNMSASPVWLVSGLTINTQLNAFRSINPTEDALLIGESELGPGNSSLFVYAPRVELPSSDMANHHYAYWIEDDGMKASLAPLYEVNLLNNPSDLNDDDFRILANQRTGLASAKPSYITREQYEYSDSLGLRLQRGNDAPMSWATIEPNDPLTLLNIFENFKNNYHDYTGRNQGLLVNTVQGGLKKDISSVSRLNPTLSGDDSVLNNAAIREALQIWQEAQTGILEPRAILGTNTPSDPSLKLTPIVTEFLFGSAISGNAATPASTEVFFYYYIFAELWNPFTKALNFSRRDIYDDMVVRISGLPSVQLRNTTTGASTAFDLPPVVMDLDFYDFILNAQQDQFDPGRLTWTGNPTGSASGVVTVNGQTHRRVNGVYLIESHPVGNITGTTVENFEADFSESDITIEFFLKGTDFDHPTDPHRLFWTMNIENYNEFSRVYTGGDGTPQSYSGSPSQFFRPRNTGEHGVNRASINQKRNHFSYYFRIDEDLFASDGTDFDLMIEHNVFQRNATTVDLGDPGDVFNIIYEVDPEPNEVDRNAVYSDLDFFSAKDSTQDTNPERWAFFIDIPTEPIVELSQLNFLVFGEDSYEKLGYANQGQLNNFYDRYFLSGYSSASSDPVLRGGLLPNPRYEVAEPGALLDFEDLASGLLLNGSFNVNSTSALAWSGILSGSNIKDWGYLGQNTRRPPVREDLKNVFFNLPSIGSRMFDPVFNNEYTFRAPLLLDFTTGPRAVDNFFFDNIPASTPVPPAFRQGFRELTDDQRLELGQEIRSLIVSRGRPFASVQEFFDSGVLQNAIENVQSINVNSDGTRIPRFSPADFNQVTIASSAGSRFSPRSDTFKIVAYGDVVNPVSGAKVTARCAVVVQRIADTIDNSPVASNANRRFIIKDFQWLD